MAKLMMFVVLAALVAFASAASFGGAKDLAGNYYDFSTGQYSSSLTGKVYNTAPVAYTAPVVAAAHASPYYYGAAASPYYYGGYPYASYPYGASYVY